MLDRASERARAFCQHLHAQFGTMNCEKIYVFKKNGLVNKTDGSSSPDDTYYLWW